MNIRQNSFVILREAIPLGWLASFANIIEQAQTHWKARGIGLATFQKIADRVPRHLSRDTYEQQAQTGKIHDVMLQMSHNRSFYEVLGFPAIFNAIAEAAAGSPIGESVVAHARTIGDLSEAVPLHYDWFYHHERKCMLNLWVPFSAVGIYAPSLALVDAPLADVIEWLDKGHPPVGGPEFVEAVTKQFDAPEHQVLRAGDAILFTNKTIHCTSFPGYDVRTAAEIRIVIENDLAFDRPPRRLNTLFRGKAR